MFLVKILNFALTENIAMQGTIVMGTLVLGLNDCRCYGGSVKTEDICYRGQEAESLPRHVRSLDAVAIRDHAGAGVSLQLESVSSSGDLHHEVLVPVLLQRCSELLGLGDCQEVTGSEPHPVRQDGVWGGELYLYYGPEDAQIVGPEKTDDPVKIFAPRTPCSETQWLGNPMLVCDLQCPVKDNSTVLLNVRATIYLIVAKIWICGPSLGK